MDGARKIASDAELGEIAAAGDGFVIDPFNRRWHAATCPRIRNMTTGEPKWYAATRDGLEEYLRQRLARNPTAQPILPCTARGETARAPRVSHQAPPPQAGAGTAWPPRRSPCIRRTDSSLEVWADDYVRNESAAATAAGQLRRQIAVGIRQLPEPVDRVLHGGYGGQRRRGTDVENLLLNNIDQTLGLFKLAGSCGVRFEDLGPTAPLAPDGTRWQSFYSYRLAPADEPFATVEQGRLICAVPDAIVPDGPARLAARIWLAVCRTRPRPLDVALEDGVFLLRVVVHQLEPAIAVKAIVDGATAAMQRDDPGRASEALARLSKLLGVDAGELLALATDAGAPLGARSRPGPASKEGLFTLDGPAQVRVTPDDHRCIAAEVVTAGMDGPARLSVKVYSAMRQSAHTA